jgi:hypothetical protein
MRETLAASLKGAGRLIGIKAFIKINCLRAGTEDHAKVYLRKISVSVDCE